MGIKKQLRFCMKISQKIKNKRISVIVEKDFPVYDGNSYSILKLLWLDFGSVIKYMMRWVNTTTPYNNQLRHHTTTNYNNIQQSTTTLYNNQLWHQPTTTYNTIQQGTTTWDNNQLWHHKTTNYKTTQQPTTTPYKTHTPINNSTVTNLTYSLDNIPWNLLKLYNNQL